MVIELFDDIAPVAVMHFRNRCSEGASDTFKGTGVHLLVKDMGAFGGRSQRYREGVHMKRYRRWVCSASTGQCEKGGQPSAMAARRRWPEAWGAWALLAHSPRPAARLPFHPTACGTARRGWPA